MQSPLHFAIKTSGSKIELIQCLLKHDANPNIKDGEGNTPLHFAIMRGSADGTAHLVVRTLLDAKADPNLKNNSGKDALGMTRDCIAPITKSSPPWLRNTDRAFYRDDYLKIVEMLEEIMPGAVRRQSTFQPSPALKIG
jgi:hypothetical protein